MHDVAVTPVKISLVNSHTEHPKLRLLHLLLFVSDSDHPCDDCARTDSQLHRTEACTMTRNQTTEL
jgi:hypothetical protein